MNTETEIKSVLAELRTEFARGVRDRLIRADLAGPVAEGLRADGAQIQIGKPFQEHCTLRAVYPGDAERAAAYEAEYEAEYARRAAYR